ncbi:hypothetical protein ANO11243_081420 [Dothideomycetidae sp. 11243]|nr:hypothetical protein ANO11243_081420 [fungal sp. No.11243]
MHATPAKQGGFRLFVFLSLAAVVAFILMGGQDIAKNIPNSLSKSVPASVSDLSLSRWRTSKATSVASTPKSRPDTLVVYAYYEDDDKLGLRNANFFIEHGLHASADFIFILQGEAPNLRHSIPNEPNIRVIQRDNTCMDLGAYGEVFRAEPELATRYKKFIFLNASVRGPFLPMWSEACWTNAFTSRLSETTKLVSMSGHCMFNIFQMQSMAFATDPQGLSVFLEEDTFACTDDHQEAITHEVHMAEKFWTKHGWESYGLLTALHGDPSYADTHACKSTDQNEDHMFNNGYYGFNVHPFESIFTKMNRDINPEMMDKFTSWFDRMQYSSYDHC